MSILYRRNWMLLENKLVLIVYLLKQFYNYQTNHYDIALFFRQNLFEFIEKWWWEHRVFTIELNCCRRTVKNTGITFELRNVWNTKNLLQCHYRYQNSLLCESFSNCTGEHQFTKSSSLDYKHGQTAIHPLNDLEFNVFINVIHR